MSAQPSVAILVLSCDKYRDVAALSIRLIEHFWASRPPIYVAGLTDEIPGQTLIPFAADPRDWIGIAHEAVGYLLDCGYDYCYLILDDHPPVSVCNGEYLGQGLPRRAREVDATVVSMVGWDQLRAFKGVKLPADMDYWLQNDPAYRWLFNLHPACWNVSAFLHILRIVMDAGAADHSARTFEAVVRAPSTPIPGHYRMSSYRVCGDRFAAVDRWFGRPMVRGGILKLLHGVRLSARLVGGSALLAQVDERARLYTDYLNGPYPMFWSGLMQRGAVHGNAVRFLQLSGQREIAESLCNCGR